MPPAGGRQGLGREGRQAGISTTHTSFKRISPQERRRKKEGHTGMAGHRGLSFFCPAPPSYLLPVACLHLREGHFAALKEERKGKNFLCSMA